MSTPAQRLEALVRSTLPRGRLLVLGMGNRMLGDDGVGCEVARALGGHEQRGLIALDAGIAIENCGPTITRARPRAILLVDAAALPGRAPWRFVPESRLDTFCHSTHSVPLPLLLAAWRQEIGRCRAWFVGIRPLSSALGAGLSPAVARAQGEILAAVRTGLGRATPGPPSSPARSPR